MNFLLHMSLAFLLLVPLGSPTARPTHAATCHPPRAGQCKACGKWNTLEKVVVQPAGDAGGGGSGARAAARFAAGRSVGGGAGSDSEGPAGGAPSPFAGRPYRRSAWVVEAEGELAGQGAAGSKGFA